MTTKAQFHIINWLNPEVQLPAPLCEIGSTGVWLFDDCSRLLHTTKGLVELPRIVAFRFKSKHVNDQWAYKELQCNGAMLQVLIKQPNANVEFLEIAK